MQNFYPNFNYQPNVERINRQIEELTQMRNQLQQPQAPVQNIINTTPQYKVDLEGKILTDGQNIKDIIVANRTIFLDEKNKKVSIKEEDGTISKEYEIIIPKTPQEKEIDELKNINNILENKLKQMEVMLNEFTKSNESIKQESKSNDVDDEFSKSSTKKSSK